MTNIRNPYYCEVVDDTVSGLQWRAYSNPDFCTGLQLWWSYPVLHFIWNAFPGILLHVVEKLQGPWIPWRHLYGYGLFLWQSKILSRHCLVMESNMLPVSDSLQPGSAVGSVSNDAGRNGRPHSSSLSEFWKLEVLLPAEQIPVFTLMHNFNGQHVANM